MPPRSPRTLPRARRSSKPRDRQRPAEKAASPTVRSPSGCHARRYDRPMRERFIGRAVLRRLPGLMAGLVIFGVGIAVMAASGLGLGPWEVFHQGISNRTGTRPGHREHPGRHPRPRPLVAPRGAAGHRDDPQRGHDRHRDEPDPAAPPPPGRAGRPAGDERCRRAADRARERALPRGRPGRRAARRPHDRAPPPLRVVDPARPDGDRAARARRRLPAGRHDRPRHDPLRVRDRAGRPVMLRIFDPEGRVSRRRRPDLAEELESPGTVGE